MVWSDFEGFWSDLIRFFHFVFWFFLNLSEKKQKSDQIWSKPWFDQILKGFDQIWSDLIRFDQIFFFQIDFF